MDVSEDWRFNESRHLGFVGSKYSVMTCEPEIFRAPRLESIVIEFVSYAERDDAKF